MRKKVALSGHIASGGRLHDNLRYNCSGLVGIEYSYRYVSSRLVTVEQVDLHKNFVF